MFSLLEYIKYLFRSFHLHGIHSPFVFQFQQDFLQEALPYYYFDEIESIRAKLLLTEKSILVDDFGAGSKKVNRAERKINQIAKWSLKNTKYAQLLHHLAVHRRPQKIIELGTSLGLTTAYLAKACPNAQVISLEGAPEIAKIARINFEKLNIENIELIEGNFDQTLPRLIEKETSLDWVYFDGNHREKATLSYFEMCLDKANENSIFIFDDIYWSPGMKRAWETIKADSRVKQSIDLFELGLIFFKKDQEKQDFTIYH